MAISQIVQNSLANTISLGPKITSVQVANSSYVVKDDTAVNVGGGYIVITGSGFQSNCSVLVDSNLACSVAFVSATQVRAELPAKPAGTYNIYVLNGDGGTAIRVNALQYSNTPTWVTTSPLASQVEDTNVSIQLSATGANTYALQAGSTLPTGLTLSANGLISGTVNTNVSVATTYNFTVEAIDTENQETPKAFAVTITVDMIIPRSLRFNPADSAYLSRTPGSAGNRRIWTWSGWVKRTQFVQYGGFFTAWSANDDAGYAVIRFDDDKLLFKDWSPTTILQTTQVFRDPSAWYHIVVAMDTTQGTASNRLRMYVNGSEITSFASSTYPSLNQQFNINNNVLHTLGVNYFSSTPTYFFGGYLAEVHFVDGTALTPSTFGQFDNKNGGVWVPKTVTGVTYGTNGFYLPFSDNTSTTTLGNDGTANNNDWTLNNFSVAAGNGNDSVVDTPTNSGTDDGSGADVTGNYATFDPLEKAWRGEAGNGTISNGNLQFNHTAASNWYGHKSTLAMTSGKWYFELENLLGGSSVQVGISLTTTATENAASVYRYRSNAQKVNTSYTSYGASWQTAGDIIGVAFDADAGTLTFYKNGVSQGVAFSGIPAGTYAAEAVAEGGQAAVINFGQRPFAYTAPSGFKTLSSHNLPTGIDANTSSTLANSYFDVVTYSGDGASSRSFTNLNFRPDLVWIKARTGSDTTFYHRFASTLMPDNNYMSPSVADTLQNATNGYIDSFDANGFTVTKGGGGVNESGSTYVAWCWNAGGSTVTNTTGSISSSVRVNQAAGFSIVSYTGNATAGATVGHGLGVAPKWAIIKGKTIATNWYVWHIGLTQPDYQMYLNLADAQDTGVTTAFNDKAPTSTVFELPGTGYGSNNSGETYEAYLWAEKEGFSKFGKYVGNGSSDGPFVYCGFRPAFILTKDISAGSYWWEMVDSKRTPINPASEALYANRNEGVYTSGYDKDILSNGFKPRSSNGGQNANGVTYIFAAFAENPFKYARAK